MEIDLTPDDIGRDRVGLPTPRDRDSAAMRYYGAARHWEKVARALENDEAKLVSPEALLDIAGQARARLAEHDLRAVRADQDRTRAELAGVRLTLEQVESIQRLAGAAEVARLDEARATISASRAALTTRNHELAVTHTLHARFRARARLAIWVLAGLHMAVALTAAALFFL